MEKNCNTVWNSCLHFIASKISEQSFRTWFKPIVAHKLEEATLTLRLPSQFFYEWLEEHYLPLLRQAIDRELGKQGKLEYSIVIDKGNTRQQPYTVKLPTTPTPETGGHYTNKKKAAKPVSKEFSLGKSELRLNPNYGFHNFIEGDCNQLAKSAAQAVAKKPGKTSFNPLMIYGSVGLGKTHLIQAIGSEVRKSFSEKAVLYVSSENFTNQFIEALRNNGIQSFINAYLQLELLIIDDIQFLAGKEKTQEIFFHIFNHLHQHGKQIVLTSDCAPRELKGLQERLLSRFKWGLTADLQQPDFETRVAIIQQKMEADGVNINGSLVQYIASSVDTNIRELEGVLVSLMAHACLNKRDIDLPLIKQVLQNIVQEVDTEVSIDFLQKAVAEHYKVLTHDLKSNSRKQEIVIPRQVGMYLAKSYTNHSLKSIGEYFGGKHHSTVIHAIQSVEDLIETDKRFKTRFEGLKSIIKLKLPS